MVLPTEKVTLIRWIGGEGGLVSKAQQWLTTGEAKAALDEFLSATGHGLQAAPAGAGRHAADEEQAPAAVAADVAVATDADDEQEEEK